ncbi:MAG: sterol desaturase family protein [Crocinitomicaceae bacterium]|nr:sterol desaturase family protein [Crocinitomicaceae bacterium]
MNLLMMIIAILLSFCGMEIMAWLTHKYVMHGFLWVLHEDHHRPSKGRFEKNDLFFLIYAVPSWLCIMFGLMAQNYPVVGIGIGIAFYGVAYFLVHDVLIHRRFKWFDRTSNRYFRAIRKAHKIHHKKMEKEDGKCFGMLLVPLKYLKEQKLEK